ncbi:hypothetical protein VTK56DRAFT_850 [Thermocarpiscus australiensis]
MPVWPDEDEVGSGLSLAWSVNMGRTVRPADLVLVLHENMRLPFDCTWVSACGQRMQVCELRKLSRVLNFALRVWTSGSANGLDEQMRCGIPSCPSEDLIRSSPALGLGRDGNNRTRPWSVHTRKGLWTRLLQPTSAHRDSFAGRDGSRLTSKALGASFSLFKRLSESITAGLPHCSMALEERNGPVVLKHSGLGRPGQRPSAVGETPPPARNFQSTWRSPSPRCVVQSPISTIKRSATYPALRRIATAYGPPQKP